MNIIFNLVNDNERTVYTSTLIVSSNHPKASLVIGDEVEVFIKKCGNTYAATVVDMKWNSHYVEYKLQFIPRYDQFGGYLPIAQNRKARRRSNKKKSTV